MLTVLQSPENAICAAPQIHHSVDPVHNLTCARTIPTYEYMFSFLVRKQNMQDAAWETN